MVLFAKCGMHAGVILLKKASPLLYIIEIIGQIAAHISAMPKRTSVERTYAQVIRIVSVLVPLLTLARHTFVSLHDEIPGGIKSLGKGSISLYGQAGSFLDLVLRTQG